MIIGNGLLARAFMPAFGGDAATIVFASGVSNSQETRAGQFGRERELLRAALRQGKYLVYFSTCSVYDAELAETPYVRHKRAMEELARGNRGPVAIFRLPQVVGRTDNPHTLTNYLHRQIASGAPFKVWLGARRNLIDAGDVCTIVCQLLASRPPDCLLCNVASPCSVSVLELVRVFEEVLGKAARYDAVAAGHGYPIEVGLAMAAAARAGVVFGPDYHAQLIRKYYAAR